MFLWENKNRKFPGLFLSVVLNIVYCLTNDYSNFLFEPLKPLSAFNVLNGSFLSR